jgi:orotate phosphoribosyltransferase
LNTDPASVSASVAAALIASGAFSVKKAGETPFAYKSGLRSPCYLNCRVLQGHPGAFHAVNVAFMHQLRPLRKDFDIIAGVPNGAIPYSIVVALLLRVPHLWIKKPEEVTKGHGIDELYTGADPKGKRVHFIEDVFTTGSSVTDNLAILERLGGIATGASGIFSYNPEKVTQYLAGRGMQTGILTNLPALVEQLSATGRFSDDDACQVSNWHQDQKGWSDRYLRDHPADVKAA